MSVSLYNHAGSTVDAVDEPGSGKQPPRRPRIPPKVWDYVAIAFVVGAAIAFNWQRISHYVHQHLL